MSRVVTPVPSPPGAGCSTARPRASSCARTASSSGLRRTTTPARTGRFQAAGRAAGRGLARRRGCRGRSRRCRVPRVGSACARPPRDERDQQEQHEPEGHRDRCARPGERGGCCRRGGHDGVDDQRGGLDVEADRRGHRQAVRRREGQQEAGAQRGGQPLERGEHLGWGGRDGHAARGAGDERPVLGIGGSDCGAAVVTTPAAPPPRSSRAARSSADGPPASGAAVNSTTIRGASAAGGSCWAARSRAGGRRRRAAGPQGAQCAQGLGRPGPQRGEDGGRPGARDNGRTRRGRRREDEARHRWLRSPAPGRPRLTCRPRSPSPSSSDIIDSTRAGWAAPSTVTRKERGRRRSGGDAADVDGQADQPVLSRARPGRRAPVPPRQGPSRRAAPPEPRPGAGGRLGTVACRLDRFCVDDDIVSIPPTCAVEGAAAGHQAQRRFEGGPVAPDRSGTRPSGSARTAVTRKAIVVPSARSTDHLRPHGEDARRWKNTAGARSEST